MCALELLLVVGLGKGKKDTKKYDAKRYVICWVLERWRECNAHMVHTLWFHEVHVR